MSAIRFIVQVTRVWDKNGYYYRCATLTATATGKSVFVASVGGDENVQSMLRRANVETNSPSVFSIISDVGAREFKRINQFHASNTVYEEAITAEMVAALETGDAS